jgi:hypothetical protein
MTKETQTELDSIQAAKKQLGEINKSFFRVDFMNTSIQGIQSILNEITSGDIKIEEIQAKLPDDRWKNILSATASKSSSYSTSDEDEGNPQLIIFTTMERSIAAQIQKLGLKDKIGIHISQLHSWLDTATLDDGQINNIVILFPIYCRPVNVPMSERNNIISKYEIHHNLVDRCSVKIVDVNDGIVLKWIQPKDLNQRQNPETEMAIVSIPTLAGQTLKERHLKTEIWHEELGFVREDNVDTSLKVHSEWSHVKSSSSTWDVFISHAKEDNDQIARPLAKALTDRSLNVWYDENNMMRGYELVENIDRGISGSNYGIIIVSKDHIQNNWTKHEFNIIRYKAVEQRKPVFSIWHKVTSSEVQSLSWDIASITAYKSDDMSIDRIADELAVSIKGLSAGIRTSGEKV